LPALFAIATLAPLLPLVLGLLLGGWWVVAAALSMTVVVGGLDLLVRIALPATPEEVEFPAGPTLSVAIGVAQLGLICLAVACLAGPGLTFAGKAVLLYTSTLWIGQVGNSNAHELIHRPQTWLRRFGTLLFVSVLYGHHASAHPKVHHRHVATPNDPATARLGESVYAYFPRAWIGGFRAGRAAERRLLESRYGAAWWKHDPYLFYAGGAVVFPAAALILFGPAGLLWYIVLSALSQMQLLISDYVQHYGLTRSIRDDGKPEPVGPAHSWNAPHWYSGAMMLQAPRHSDHHAHPARPFNHLSLPPKSEAPRLPYSLPIMGAIAMLPTLWRRVMDRRANRWRTPLEPPTHPKALNEHVA